MHKRIPLLLLLCLSFKVYAQHELRAYVVDSISGNPISEASIQLEGYIDIFGLSDSEGFFSLNIPEKQGVLVVRHISYEPLMYRFSIENSEVFRITMEPSEAQIEEIVIMNRKDNARNNELKRIQFGQGDIEKMTGGFGEADVIRSLQQMPGVHKSNEVNAALNVRGTGHGSNNISLDGQEIYNSYHLLGIAPMFNPDILENVSLMKSGFHPEQGKAISSYLDVESRDPDLYDGRVSVSLGNLSSSASFEGPIEEGKSSILLAGRFSFFDIIGGIYEDLHLEEEDFNPLPYYRLNEYYVKFHFNLKNDWKADFSTFHTSDHFLYQSVSVLLDIQWKNQLYALNFSKSLDERSRVEIHSGLSDYRFEGNYNPATVIFRNNNLLSWDSRVSYTIMSDAGVKWDVGAFSSISSYFIWCREMLVDYMLREVEDRDKTYLTGLYGNGRVSLGELSSIEAGLRFSHYFNEGHIFAVEPRFQVNSEFGSMAINFSYDRTYQYSHLISPLGFNMPADLWAPAGGDSPVQRCDQLAFHVHKSLGVFKADFGVFHKWLRGVSDLATGAELVSFQPAEALVFGSGYAYGFETGWHYEGSYFKSDIYYTYAHSRRVIAEINGGDEFSPAYDLPHQVDVVFGGDFGKELSWSLSWYWASGQVVTMPSGYVFLMQGVEALPYPIYTERNNMRMPASHRADASIQHTRKREWGESIVAFGVYNVYHQSNPYYLYFSIDELAEGNYEVVPKKMAIFPMTPFLNIKIRWE